MSIVLDSESFGDFVSGVSEGAIVSYASNFLGTPYLWGGTSPPGFDCSGFTQYVYAHFRISIGRTTFEQINNGIQVSRDNLQPGDVIKITALGRKDFVTARRVK